MTTRRARRLTKRTSLTSIEPMALQCRLARLQAAGQGLLEGAAPVAPIITVDVVGVAAGVALVAVPVAAAVRQDP